MIHRAPSGHRCGESHPKSRLTDAEVRAARWARENRGESYGSLAKRFQTSIWTMRDILTYRTRINAGVAA